METEKTLLELFTEFAQTGVKIIVPIPDGDIVDLLETEKHLIAYAHRKGSNWNFGGSHWYYVHDKNTGSFENSYTSISDIKVIRKERILKNESIKLRKLTINHGVK